MGKEYTLHLGPFYVHVGKRMSARPDEMHPDEYSILRKGKPDGPTFVWINRDEYETLGNLDKFALVMDEEGKCMTLDEFELMLNGCRVCIMHN